ncbi:MAG TPA: tRNA (adenosine(37)-N6)-threonylcarbamoyltransferase complex dimerization subunit type 1 TsaB [Alphaproteobacteria bacterium]|nr:tRNA (adenosine(37)-N6)-threonylcarbamoyltransferase complex dimerization subunit type 1 TsaB [Alphaproteobacteria bacterium]
MKILALDTSGDACSVALYDARAQKLLAEERMLIERGHAEILFSQIARVTERGETSLKSIDRFAVTIGPGTFTGVRIGLAAARGFALAARKPLTGVSSLEVVAHGADAPASAVVVAAFDARRGELYVQAFQDNTTVLGPMAATPEGAAAAIADASNGAEVFIVGTGAGILRAALTSRNVRAELASGEALPRAGVLARIAATRAEAAEPVTPLYLRAPDAKLPARS